MTGLSRRVLTQVFQWLYRRHEVIVFRAAPWDEAANSHAEADVIPIKQGVCDGGLPCLAPGAARELHRHIAWRSRNNDVCFLLMVDGCGVGYGWIRSAGEIEIEEIGLSLILDSSQICLFDFYIDPSFRGRGLYTNFLWEIRRRFKGAAALIYAESWNVASLSGIVAAGFTPLASVRGICLFGRRFPTGIRASPSCSLEAPKQ